MVKRSTSDEIFRLSFPIPRKETARSTYTLRRLSWPETTIAPGYISGKVNVHPSYCWNFYPPPTFSWSREGGVAVPVSLEALNRTSSVAFIAFRSFFVESCDEVLDETAQFFINYFICYFILAWKKRCDLRHTRKFFTERILHVSVLDRWSSWKMKNMFDERFKIEVDDRIVVSRFYIDLYKYSTPRLSL